MERIEWKKGEEEDGGVTWIELYALYVIHGGNADEEEERSKDVLNKPPLLQKQLADFKKAVRKVKKHTIPEENEWVFETSYS